MYNIWSINNTCIAGNPDANPPVADVAAIQTTGSTFQINNANFYVSLVTLSVDVNIKILENIKQGFKRTISWNKYWSEIQTQTKNNNLDSLIIDYVTHVTMVWLIQHLGTLIDCLLFHSKMVMMILQEILLMSIICH